MLIRWAGDSPEREGLRDTPERVARAFGEWFSGYGQDPVKMLERTFGEVGEYVEPVMLRDIPFSSYCEHHLAPIRGVVHISYIPVDRVVGISKLARVVDVYARRLQIQERFTVQIADAIRTALRPRGVAVLVEAEHACMTSRGARAHGTRMLTKRMVGEFETNGNLRREFLSDLKQYQPMPGHRL